MSNYGMRIKDALTKDTLLLTPDLLTVVSSGRVDMLDTLEDDDTYGIDIDLPGSTSYTTNNVGVLITPVEINVNTLMVQSVTGAGPNGGAYATTWFMNNTYTFYTRNATTGVMTEWVPDVTPVLECDSVLAIYPIAFWDKMNATKFTSVRLFVAMCYEIYDQSETAFNTVYAIGSQGVEHADYAIYMRNYSEI